MRGGNKLPVVQKANEHEELLREVFPALKFPETKMVSNKYHCDLCCCPTDKWNPYADYQSDRSCELFYFLEGLLAEEKGREFTVNRFVEKHEQAVKQEFPDLGNLAGVFREHLEWQLEVGDVEEISTGVYVAAVWPERKETQR